MTPPFRHRIYRPTSLDDRRALRSLRLRPLVLANTLSCIRRHAARVLDVTSQATEDEDDEDAREEDKEEALHGDTWRSPTDGGLIRRSAGRRERACH